jgi:hypothetical protein
MKKTWGVYVVEFFAVLMMLIGTALMVIEGVAHYRPYFTHKTAVLTSNWTATPFIVGGVLILFGAMILAYALVKPAVDELEDASGFIAKLIDSVKLWGNRSTDKAAAEIVAKTGELPVPIKPDPDKDKV